MPTSLITSLHPIGAIQLGEFTLKSGQRSPTYINLRNDPKAKAREYRERAFKAYEKRCALPTLGFSVQ